MNKNKKNVLFSIIVLILFLFTSKFLILHSEILFIYGFLIFVLAQSFISLKKDELASFPGKKNILTGIASRVVSLNPAFSRVNGVAALILLALFTGVKDFTVGRAFFEVFRQYLIILAVIYFAVPAAIIWSYPAKNSPGIKGVKYGFFFIFAVFVAVLIKNAWACDDAFICFRVADNFVNGYGLRWNIIERVQVFTNPLWTLLFSGIYFFTREALFTSTTLSVLVSTALIIIFSYVFLKDRAVAPAAIFVLLMSKAFIDYSVSGLENPLSHLMILIFFIIYCREQACLFPAKKYIFLLSLSAGLGTLTRPDLILIFIIPLVHAVYSERKQKPVLPLLAGVAPLIGWGIFAFIYYGYALPNTLWAKVFSGVPKVFFFKQGLYYIYDSLMRDPVTLATVFTAVSAAVLVYKKEKRYVLLGAGIVLYFLYIIRVGGDYMSGRFFTVPFFVSILILAHIAAGMKKKPLLIYGLFVLFLWAGLGKNPVLSGKNYLAGEKYRNIVDERGIYYPITGLLNNIVKGPLGEDKWKILRYNFSMTGDGPRFYRDALDGAIEEKHTIISGTIGLLGYYAGPNVHIIDVFGLADPVLARIPCPEAGYSAGHYYREMPKGYYETVKTGENVIEDEKASALYEKMRVLTQYPVWSGERLKARF